MDKCKARATQTGKVIVGAKDNKLLIKQLGSTHYFVLDPCNDDDYESIVHLVIGATEIRKKKGKKV